MVPQAAFAQTVARSAGPAVVGGFFGRADVGVEPGVDRCCGPPDIEDLRGAGSGAEPLGRLVGPHRREALAAEQFDALVVLRVTAGRGLEAVALDVELL